MIEDRLHQLTEQEVDGLISAAGAEELAGLLEGDPGNRVAYQEVKEILEATTEGLNRIDPKTDTSLMAIMGQIQEEAPENDTPVISLPQRNRSFRWVGIAAAAVLLAVVGYLVAPQFMGGGDGPQVYATNAGKIDRLILSDESEVTLNAGSRLAIAESFGEEDRAVDLEGEAFFEIEPNPEKPFVIRSAGTEVRVLGTSFNVSAYPGTDRVLVNVNSGKVAFSAEGKTLLLTKGQSAFHNSETGALQMLDSKVDDALAWQNRELVFQLTPLPEVLVRLEKHYDLEISASDDLMNEQLTSRFDLNDHSEEEMLAILSESLRCKFEQNGRRVTLVK